MNIKEILKNVSWSYFGMGVAVAITLIAGNNWSWLSVYIFLGVAVLIGIALTIQREVSARKEADRSWQRAVQSVNELKKYVDSKEEK